MSGERAVDDVFFLNFIVMRRDVKMQFFAQRDSARHPDLAQFVVAMAFETIFELFTMFLQFVRQTTPLDAQQEHPVNRLLQCFMPTIILVELAHSLLTVTQVKRLFLVYFHKGTLPGAKSCAIVDITEQDIAHPVVESVSYNQFHPTIQGYIKGIGVLKITRFALKNEFLCIDTQITHQAIGYMCMAQLILDN